MPAKRFVPVATKAAGSRVVTIEEGATLGATVGLNLWLDDGTLVTKEMLFAQEAPDDELGFTYWRLIQEVPPNVVALEEATGTGLFAVTGDGTGAMRSIEVADGELTVSNGSGVSGNPLLGLPDVPDVGGGELQKTDFDAKGRKVGTSAATTDDLPEGATNLYFTSSRVRETVLTGLSLASSAVIAATDTVLSALGKLQAQITALGSTVSGLVVNTITNGDTTHAPSGDAVFDAMAGKLDKGSGTSGGTVGPLVVEGVLASVSAGGAINFGGFAGQGSSAMVFFGNGGNLRFRSESRTTVSGVGVVPGSFFPEVDNSVSNGLALLRWSVVYAATGTINTSDAREKTVRGPLNEQELAAGMELASAAVIYQWNAAIAEKGIEAARLHCGPTVQSVIAIMESHGLDPFRYGFVCHDEWPERIEPAEYETVEVEPAATIEHPAIYERTQVYTEDGQPERFAERMVSPVWTEIVTPAVTEERLVREEVVHPAGDRYSLRPDELAAFRDAALAQNQASLDARLKALGG